MAERRNGRFEVHEHSFIAGPRGRSGRSERLVHSHFGGNVPHTHPDTGPGVYIIGKEDWLRATGLKGGGRKKFTDEPSGEQLPTIPRSPEECTFEVIVGPPPPNFGGQGAGIAPIARMALAFGMTPIVRGPGPGGRKRRNG